MKLPEPRGPVSGAVAAALSRSPHDLDPGLGDLLATPGPDPTALLADEDLQLTLFLLYELAYRGWDGVDDGWEWHPDLIRLRGVAEDRLETALRALAAPHADEVPADLTAATVAQKLVAMTAEEGGPSLSKYLRGRATLEQFREFAAHRSVYHLREADPHTFAIPRLAGRAKAALIEIQMDEYGNGRVQRMHQELFRHTMTGLGLDTTYGAYVAQAPALTLASNNLMSLFGLHRRHRGALLGHLAAYEMTSTVPNRAYGNGLRRLGGDADATRFYDEHVEADAVHEQIAAHDMCGSFCVAEPELAADLLFGARSALAVDTLWAGYVLERWSAGESSLRPAP
ncbi:iron-containing redox enzyme family protein [Jidongwangia harbinensis]|uniref:iron-containing redox enzyme family protein n=1 Tax=Jidongwangia harbinensis TaxID=2878561 RepID=UPI001CD91EAB|nr:iron-containing redox enzyme family protein [Jidongwangia harbinensis]MCA2218804.1 iron-containing redox enzyme family protein [Jidongwangia harbinensis]